MSTTKNDIAFTTGELCEVRSEIITGQIDAADVATYITLRTEHGLSHSDALNFVTNHSVEELGETAFYVAVSHGMTASELYDASEKALGFDNVDYVLLLQAYMTRRVGSNHQQALNATFGD